MKKTVMVLTMLAAPVFALSEVRDVEMSYHSDYDYYSMKLSGHFEATFQVFLDADNNKQTGYTRKQENPKAIGADYLIEGSNLFKYEGKNGSSEWEGWRYLYDLNSFGDPYVWISPNEIIIDLNREIFNLGNRFNYGVRALNSNWGVDDVYPKKGDRIMLRYTKPPQSCASGDRGFVYKNLDQITFAQSSEKKNIRVTRNEDNTLLLNTNGAGKFYHTSQGNRVKVSHGIAIKSGGFDVVYRIRNRTDANNSMPTLIIPGIHFGETETLNMLNPLFKHYLQERNITQEQQYYKEGSGDVLAHSQGSNYFAVANAVRTVGAKKYELHFPYGKDDTDGNAQFVYSPVIVATNDSVAIGSSLNLNSTKKSERLHVKMSIIKNQNGNWSYAYDLSNNKMAPGTTLRLSVSVRFANSDKWIFTLYPYKELFNSSLSGEKNIPTKKDLRPIQTVSFAFRAEKGASDWSRAWNSEFTGSADYNNSSIKFPLKESLKRIGTALKDKGYKRTLIWNFTGLYNNTETGYGAMSEQLPFQFVSSLKGERNILPENMYKDMTDIIDNGLPIFNDIAMGYDWGISGNIPVADEYNNTLAVDAWQPHNIVPFDYCNDEHKTYARYYLDEAKNLQGIFKPKLIRLDAFVRMDLDGRIKWLKELKESKEPKKGLPETTFALESSIDYMHARSASILQLDSTQVWINGSGYGGSKEEHTLTQPDLLAHYLNPGAETLVAIQQSIFRDRNKPDERKGYLKDLVTLGYTPLISFWGLENYIVDINDINNIAVNPCFDGIDNDGDGQTDWPYDDNCRIDMNASSMSSLKE